MGWDVHSTFDLHTVPMGDLIAGYGWRNYQMFKLYRDAGRPFIYVDLGYWNRKKARSDYGGYHKVVLNARHATEYFQRGRPSDRRTIECPTVSPWQPEGRHIIIAGLSGKGALSSGLKPLEWEQWAIKVLRRVTDRPIVYRPKPSWKDARPIPLTQFSPGTVSIEDALVGAYALVTLHSNAAIDALCAGVPIFAGEGLASVMSVENLRDIVEPRRDIDREQFLNDVSYCHWRRSEIASGAVFQQFVDDGLIR